MGFQIILFLLFAAVAFVSASLQHVEYSVHNFMKYYLPGHSVWLGHTSYMPDWCRANGVEAISNYMYYYGNSSRYNLSEDYGTKIDSDEEESFWQVLTELQDNQGTDFYQDAEYFDDVLWWSLAYTRAYEVSVNRGDTRRANRFLATSIDIHDVVTRDSWTDQPCNGGVFWSRDLSYKNAITNELYFSAAVRLFRITENATFFDRATKTLNWLRGSGMIQSNFLIVDGLSNATCKAQGTIYTYNQGVLFGGLAELSVISNDTYKADLISLGENIASAVSTNMTDSNGILIESLCGDGALFKGIYTRYLRYFLDIAKPSSSDSLRNFLTLQSKSIWETARDASTGFIAKAWAGPPGSKYHNLQISGIDSLTAAGDLLKEKNLYDDDTTTASDCSGHGFYVDGACLCDERFSGSACEVETNVAYYYPSQRLTFTSSSSGRVLCVEPSTLIVTTCVDDDEIAAGGTFTLQQYHDAFQLLYVDEYNQNYLLSAQEGKVSMVFAATADPASDTSTFFSYATAFPSQDILYSDSFSLRTSDGKYVSVDGLDVSANSSVPSETTIFGVNYAQVC